MGMTSTTLRLTTSAGPIEKNWNSSHIPLCLYAGVSEFVINNHLSSILLKQLLDIKLLASSSSKALKYM